MANKPLNYDLTFIDTISSLAPINEQLIFKKVAKEDGTKVISLKANNPSRTVLYTLEAPEAAFNFEGDSLAMLKYNKFKSYFQTYCTKNEDEKPVLTTEQDELNQPRFLYIKSAVIDSQIKHHLANEDTIEKPCFNSIDAGSADTDFTLTSDQFTQIKKMISMVGADSVKFAVNGNVVTVTLFNTKSSDVFTQAYTADVDADEPFAVTTPASGFSIIPDADYRITIDKEGLVVLHQEREDNIKLTLYVAEA